MSEKTMFFMCGLSSGVFLVMMLDLILCSVTLGERGCWGCRKTVIRQEATK